MKNEREKIKINFFSVTLQYYSFYTAYESSKSSYKTYPS